MFNSKPRILVVDDELDLSSTICEILQTEVQANVLAAANGQEALLLCGDSPFDLIISDINMPALNGIQFLEELRRQGMLTPIIFLTGYGSKELVVKAIRLGAIDFIEKPFRNTDLIDIVNRQLNILMRTRKLHTTDNSEENAKMIGLLKVSRAKGK